MCEDVSCRVFFLGLLRLLLLLLLLLAGACHCH
jgi:hypothetical protein